jgi:hypothetical protein
MDVEEPIVGIKFGTHMINLADILCIKLDETGLFSSLCAAY